jgi:uncharacterized protein YycO
MPKIGNYGVVQTNGVFAFLIKVGTFSLWNHAVIYIGNNQIIEATLRGVRISHVSKYKIIAWNNHEILTYRQRKNIVAHAQTLVGDSYNFIDILNLALRILGIKILSTRLVQKWADTKGYICSELAAECYQKAGARLGKKPYLITPAYLANRIIFL